MQQRHPLGFASRASRIPETWQGRGHAGMSRTIALFVFSACVLSVRAANVYRCTGSDGATVYSDKPCGNDAVVQDVRPLEPRGVARPAGPAAPTAAPTAGRPPDSQQYERQIIHCQEVAFDRSRRAQTSPPDGDTKLAKRREILRDCQLSVPLPAAPAESTVHPNPNPQPVITLNGRPVPVTIGRSLGTPGAPNGGATAANGLPTPVAPAESGIQEPPVAVARDARAPHAIPRDTRAAALAETWEYLHLGSVPFGDYDAMVPFLARTVAPLDANWGPQHVHWAAVNELIRKDLHEDVDVKAERARKALAAIGQRALDRSLSDDELAQLLQFIHSTLGKDYASFQQQLSSINNSAGAELMRRMTGQSSGREHDQSATPQQVAERRRVQELSLEQRLARSQLSDGAAAALLDKMVLATRGDALDLLALHYANEFAQFDKFNRSAPIAKIAATAPLMTELSSHDPAFQDLKAALAAEPQKRAAEWRATYDVAPDTSPSLPRAEVKLPGVLEPGDALFPGENPHPTHRLEIAGTLPTSVPLADFEAIYATDLATKENISGPCQRHAEHFSYPDPLEVIQTVAIVRNGDRYRASVSVDRYQPGRCNWHLRELRDRLFVSGFGYRSAHHGNGGQIQVMDANHRAIEIARGAEVYEGQLDIWCGKMLNRNIAPHYPVGCGTLDDFRPRVPTAAFASVPELERQSHALVIVSPDTTSVEENFHDVDVLRGVSLTGR